MLPVVRSLVFVEDQYRVEETGQAWHLSALYYQLARPDAAAAIVDLRGAFLPEWVPLSDLQRTQMQFGFEAVQAGRLRVQR